MKKSVILLLLILLAGACISCQKPGSRPLSLFNTICAADEALAASKNGQAVVFEGRKCTSGQMLWEDFCQKADLGIPASVLCAHYHTLDPAHMSREYYEAEKDSYPRLFFYQLTYDGNAYTVTIRQSTEKEPECQERFLYLRHYTGEAPTQARFSSYEYYVLTDDPTVTWETIEAGLFSSQADAGYRHCPVYQNTFD